MDAYNVRRWSGSGGIFVDFAGGAQLPTDSSTPLGPGWQGLGYLSDSGVSITQDSQTDSVFAWQNGANVRTLETSHDLTFGFEMLEFNEVTQQMYFGNVNIQGNDAVSKIVGGLPGSFAYVIQAFDGLETLRIVIEKGEITERGELSLVNTGIAVMPITLTAYPGTEEVKATVYRSIIGSN